MAVPGGAATLIDTAFFAELDVHRGNVVDLGGGKMLSKKAGGSGGSRSWEKLLKADVWGWY